MRLIDADALLKHEVEADRMSAMLVVGKGFILDAPTIEPKRGKWIEEFDNDGLSWGTFYCSECHKAPASDYNERSYLSDFCPNCGADMRQQPQKGE